MVLDRFTWLSKVMVLCLVIAQVDLKRVMSDGLALVMLKCTLIHACCDYNLMIELLWLCIQLYDMHIDLTRLDVVGLVMYMSMT